MFKEKLFVNFKLLLMCIVAVSGKRVQNGERFLGRVLRSASAPHRLRGQPLAAQGVLRETRPVRE